MNRNMALNFVIRGDSLLRAFFQQAVVEVLLENQVISRAQDTQTSMQRIYDVYGI